MEVILERRLRFGKTHRHVYHTGRSNKLLITHRRCGQLFILGLLKEVAQERSPADIERTFGMWERVKKKYIGGPPTVSIRQHAARITSLSSRTYVAGQLGEMVESSVSKVTNVVSVSLYNEGEVVIPASSEPCSSTCGL